MISLLLPVAFLLIAGLAVVLYGKWLATIDGFWRSVWIGTIVLASVRISLFGIGQLLMATAEQVLGYVMIMAAFPEAVFARGVRGRSTAWAFAVAALVIAGSFVGTLCLSYFVRRPRLES